MREFNRTLMIRSWQLHQLLANRTAVRYPMADTEKKANPYALPAATMRSQIRLQQSAAMISISAD